MKKAVLRKLMEEKCKELHIEPKVEEDELANKITIKARKSKKKKEEE